MMLNPSSESSMRLNLKADPKLLEGLEFDHCFNWEECKIDVEQLREALFKARYAPSEKQEMLLNELEAKHKLIKTFLNQKGQAEDLLGKCGIHDSSNRELYEGKVVSAGNKVFETRQETLELSNNLSKSLGWQLTSGMAHSLAQDVSGAVDGSYNVLRDEEAQSLYNESIKKSDEEFYETVNLERSDKYYFLRPKNIKNLSQKLSDKNVTEIKRLLEVAALERLKTKSPNEAPKEEAEDGDPLDAYMNTINKQIENQEKKDFNKTIMELESLYDEYRVLLKRYYQVNIPEIETKVIPEKKEQTMQVETKIEVSNKVATNLPMSVGHGPYSASATHDTAASLIAAVLARKNKSK